MSSTPRRHLILLHLLHLLLLLSVASMDPVPFENVTTASSYNNTTVTMTPGASTTPPPPGRVNSFDAASFIGGVVLSLALVAIVFITCRVVNTHSPSYDSLT
uniref:Sialomucin core protein 24-like isoform X2 n=1 Tax=Petromyzon marinus TaxID=7757 RepID=A0AAJ7UJW0_PETMA|nr:sialomucin core protein 24-like isoform X2 [Petromyzon marinus]XP_032836566.1 sialomucin core protein 24-like isoform X3 [Petromyzon marinus]